MAQRLIHIFAHARAPYRFELEQDIYSGPRGTNGLQTIQNIYVRTRPRIFLQLRKTF